MGTPDRQRPAAEALKPLIREAGLRCTVARLAVLEHMLAAPGPQTHAEVSAALDHRGFDRATIYRNLTELTEARLVTRVDLGDHVWRFEARRQGTASDPHQGGDHPHFVCTSCGEVSCLDDVNVAITPRPGGERAVGNPARRPGGVQRPGLPSVTEVVLKGTCGNCGEEP